MRTAAPGRSENCHPSKSTYPDCLRYSAAYRVAFVTCLFFASMSAITAFAPDLHDRFDAVPDHFLSSSQ